RLDDADAPRDCAAANLAVELLAHRRVDLLRVVEAGKDAATRQDHGRRDDGPGERAPPRLVDAGDARVAAAEELLLEPRQIPQAAQLREESGQGIGVHVRGDRAAGRLIGLLLVDPGRLALADPEVVELGATDGTLPLHLDALDDGRVQG